MVKLLKKLDLVLLAILPVIAASVTLLLRLNYFWAIILFFGPLALWLSLRTPKMVARTALFAFTFAIPAFFLANYIPVQDSAWYVPTTIFPFRILGTLPLEDFIMVFLLVYNVVICYEHFLDKGRHKLVDRKMKYFVWGFGGTSSEVVKLARTASFRNLEIRNPDKKIGTIFTTSPF